MDKAESLPPDIKKIICDKATECAFSGEYTDTESAGTYLCRQCGLALYRANNKFHSGCGWPSFDQEIEGAIKREMDADGRRTEILCVRCLAHLGHVFTGEGFTPLNIRHCVNSASLDFVHDLTVLDTEEAIVAAGCFWGVEHLFLQLAGVLKAEVGYIGGHTLYPSYNQVCSGETGHVEAVRVIYDIKKIKYEKIIKYFFEIHNASQTTGQGPDIGSQYKSKIYYFSAEQKHIAEILIAELKDKGYKIATQLKPVAPFWRAEEYHQNYYKKTGKEPYCHIYEKKF